MKEENWIWMPHAGHFVLRSRCLFHLNTYVGGYIVSTIGHLVPKGTDLAGAEEKTKYEKLGHDRYFETMVFVAGKVNNDCCPYEICGEGEVDMKGYNDPGDARKGHMKMCKKWSKIKGRRKV